MLGEGPAQLLKRIPAHAVEAGDVALARLGELFKRRVAGGGERTPGRRREPVERDRVGLELMPVMTGAIGELP